MLIAGAARRAAAVAAAPLASIDMPVLSLIQVRLATQLAVAHDQTLGPERAPELAPILLGGYGWRALSRLAQMRLPAPALVRGAIAAAATVGVGAGAEAWYRSRNVPGSMDELRELVEGAVRRRAAS
jgi:uncharacterized protein (DUF697 family)